MGIQLNTHYFGEKNLVYSVYYVYIGKNQIDKAISKQIGPTQHSQPGSLHPSPQRVRPTWRPAHPSLRPTACISPSPSASQARPHLSRALTAHASRFHSSGTLGGGRWAGGVPRRRRIPVRQRCRGARAAARARGGGGNKRRGRGCCGAARR